MPKGKRRGKSDRNRFDGSASDDDSLDNASVFSNYSENKSADDDNANEGDDLAQEQFEDKLIETLDGLTQKSAQGRTNCLASINKVLVSKYVPGFIIERHFTICDGIERCLKKGGVAEKGAAAELASVLCVQLGADEVSEVAFKSLKPVLLTTLLDNTAAPSVRAKCCSALSLISFLSGGEMGDILTLMQNLQSIFSGSYLKGDGSTPNLVGEVGSLHAAALSSWALLLTLMDASDVASMVENSKTFPSLEQLSELLKSQHLEVRLTAGETLALVFELGRIAKEDFCEDFAEEIASSLKELATDSHKYRAKKDRKQQRATFRDILQFIEDDSVSDVQVKFGKEVLLLDSWIKRKQYDALCSILGPGINIHLAENELLRDIFEIGAPIIDAVTPAYAQNQKERYLRRMINAANFKARTKSRAKNRDKRSDF